jgi:hypothetical protein
MNMHRSTHARIAGVTFLLYIAVAFPSFVLMGRATNAEGVAGKLAQVALHVSDVRLAILLTMLSCFSAIVLGVTLYAVTRVEDHDLSVFTLVCRVAEGTLGMIGIPSSLALLWLSANPQGGGFMDASAANTIAASLLMPAKNAMLGAPFFALGSLSFAYLLWRGRMIPRLLAGLGVISSMILVVCLPLQISGFLSGPVLQYIWLPMLAFEVPLGLWLLIKAVPEHQGDGLSSP